MAYRQLTRADLRGLAQARLGAARSVFWRDDELNRLLQEALRVWNCLTGYWKSRQTLTTVAGEHWYTLQGTITSALRVTFNSKVVSSGSINDLDMGQPQWESETTTSGGSVPSIPTIWAPAGLTMIVLWPADSAGANGLAVDGIAATPILIDDDSFVDIGDEAINQILDYVEHIALFKEGGAEFEATQSLLQSFLQGAADENAILRHNGKFRLWMGEQPVRPRRDDATVGVRG